MNLYEHTIIARQDTSPSELKQLTVKVKKFDLETNFFSKKDELDKKEKHSN